MQRPHFPSRERQAPPTRIQPQPPANLRAEVLLNGRLHRDRMAKEPTEKVRTR